MRAETDEVVDVLAVSSFPPGVGGGEIQTRAQLLSMARRGIGIHVIDLEPRHAGPKLERDGPLVVHRVLTPRAPVVRAIAYHVRLALLAWRLGRRSKVAQINHLGTGMLTVAPLLAAVGVPRALVIWGSAAPGVGPFGRGWRNRAARWMARRQTAVIALSSVTRKHLLDHGFSDARLAFVPNGVDVDRFRPLAPSDPAWTAPPGWPARGPIVLTVGRLVPAKGLDVLIEAWRTVVGEVPEAKLVIAGDGPLGPECASAAARLGIERSVVLLGARSDVPDLLRHADAYVSSSRTEGMSNALLEALASGLPLVATRVGGAADTIDDGVNGRLVAPGDASALAGALRDVLADDAARRAMGAASRRIALERFALDAIVSRYLDLFRQLEAAA